MLRLFSSLKRKTREHLRLLLLISTTQLTFNPGDTTKAINVVINEDAICEGTETFTLILSNSENASISDSTGQGTIVDDDSAPSVTLSLGGGGGV